MPKSHAVSDQKKKAGFERGLSDGDRSWRLLSWLLLVSDGFAFCRRHHEPLLDHWIDGLSAHGKTHIESALEQTQHADGACSGFFWSRIVVE